jgi:hypothetical protein
MTIADLDDLRHAKQILEGSSLAIRLANLVGAPIERSVKLLPTHWAELVNQASYAALQRALDVAIATLNASRRSPAANAWHKAAVAATGAVGGAFGMATLSVELPVSTTIMLRSIVDIARSEGEAVQTIEAKLACLQVFAFGGRTTADDAAESGYFAVRAALARAVAEAAELIAERGLTGKGAPVLARLVGQIAARFGVVVSDKIVAQAVPLLGAAGGAAINLMFVTHFQLMARGHFIVRRLERRYGVEIVRAAYGELPV